MQVGEAAGVGEEAARTVDRLRARLRRLAAAAAQASAASEHRPRVLILQSLQPLRTAGWWAGDMAALAGGLDLVECPGDCPRELSWREVQVRGPGVPATRCCGRLWAGACCLTHLCPPLSAWHLLAPSQHTAWVSAHVLNPCCPPLARPLCRPSRPTCW